MRQVLYAQPFGDLCSFAGNERPGDGRSQHVSLIGAVGFDEREEAGLYKLCFGVDETVFIGQLLCPLVSTLDILLWLADVHKNGNDLVKPIAFSEERYTDRGIQASGIGQYNFRHCGSPLSYKIPGRFNFISYLGRQLYNCHGKTGWPMTQLIKTAAFSVDFDRDTRALRAHGALTPMIQPVLKMINQRLAEEKPAQVRLKDIVASTWLPPIPSGPFQRLLLNEARVAIGRPVPQTVSIEVTRLCGAKCDHCLIKEKTGELSREDILRVIDEALKMGACIITFTEGDPLLREDIFELIRYVDPEKAVVNLFTPGLEMTEEKAVKLREAGLYNLIIGIYSTTLRSMTGCEAWKGLMPGQWRPSA